MDDKTTIDDYIQKSRFKIPNCYQIPISSVSNIIGLNTKKVSENMPIPLVSPNEQVSTDIACEFIKLLNSEYRKEFNVSRKEAMTSFVPCNTMMTKSKYRTRSPIIN